MCQVFIFVGGDRLISSNLVDDFLDYMKSTKGSSDNTVKEYYYDLRVFARFIKRRKNLVDDSIDFNDIPIEDISPEEKERFPIDRNLEKFHQLEAFIIICMLKLR